MNIAVLGKNRINNFLKEQLEFEGFTPLLFQKIENIKSVKGEKGAFVIKSSEGSFQVSHIIVTEEPSVNCENVKYNDFNTLDPKDFEPQVFVLDYPSGCSTMMFRTALEKAIEFAKKKRKVIFLARFMKTAGDSLESLYKYARNLGIVFFKYDHIEVEYLDEQKNFQIIANDMYGSMKILTSAPVFAGEGIYSDTFLRLIKILKIKLDSKEQINENKYFLFPWFTSRRGIYFTSLNSITGSSEELMVNIRCIIADIKGVWDAPDTFEGKNNEQYARIDSEKCAFCYTCYRACPHFAMAPDYENSVMKNLTISCYGCGICYSVCPAHAIAMVKKTSEHNESDNKPENKPQEKPENRFDNTSDNVSENMSDYLSDNLSDTGSLKIFCCENSGEIAFSRIADKLQEDGIKVSITPVACGGEISSEKLIATLKDFRKVLVAVCVDDACRHFEGNKRAKRYVDRAKNMLKSSGIDENRIVYLQLSHQTYRVLDEYIREELFHDCG